MVFRGSRKHVLELLERPDYVAILNGLLDGTGAVVTLAEPHQPTGFADPTEDELPAFCRKHLNGLIDPACLDVGHWWTLHSGTTPNWDLLSTIRIGDRRGLLLVEAKAHALELKTGGKPLRAGASSASRANHDFIARCIDGASGELGRCTPGFQLSRDGHYQLSNRIAWAWKMACCGVPVVLLYLGFTGDTYFDADFLRDDAHWQTLMRTYLAPVAPPQFATDFVTFSTCSTQQNTLH
jgi:hypothetical protein